MSIQSLVSTGLYVLSHLPVVGVNFVVKPVVKPVVNCGVKGKSLKKYNPRKYLFDLNQQIQQIEDSIVGHTRMRNNHSEKCVTNSLNRLKSQIKKDEIQTSNAELTRQYKRLKYHQDNLKQMLVNPAGLNDFDAYMAGADAVQIAVPITEIERKNIKAEVKEIKTTMTEIKTQKKELLQEKKHLSNIIKLMGKKQKELSAFAIADNKICNPIFRSLNKLRQERDNMVEQCKKNNLSEHVKDVILIEKADKKIAICNAKEINMKAFNKLPFHMLRYIVEFLPMEIRTEMYEKTYSPYKMRKISSVNEGRCRITLKTNTTIMKHLQSLPEVKTICLANPEIYSLRPGVMVNKMKLLCLMHSLKTENPVLAYKIIRKISILFLQSNRLPTSVSKPVPAITF